MKTTRNIPSSSSSSSSSSSYYFAGLPNDEDVKQNAFANLLSSSGWSSNSDEIFASIILKFLLIREIESLRRVCNDLKHFIDNSKFFESKYYTANINDLQSLLNDGVDLTIISLDLSNGGKIDDDRMEIIGKAFPQIRRLNLSGMQGSESLTIRSARVLDRLCYNSLEELNLSGLYQKFLTDGTFLNSIHNSQNSSDSSTSISSLGSSSSFLRSLILRNTLISSITFSSCGDRLSLLEELDIIDSLLGANYSFLLSMPQLKSFSFNLKNAGDCLAFDFLSQLLHLRILSIHLSYSLKKNKGEMQSISRIPLGFRALERFELTFRKELCKDETEELLILRNESKNFLAFLQAFNDLPTLHSILLRIQITTIKSPLIDPRTSEAIMQIIIGNRRLKTLSIELPFDSAINFDTIQIISYSTSLEILSFPRLIAKDEWALLKSMKSLRVLRIKLLENQRSFLDPETRNWLVKDRECIEDYLISKDKTTAQKEMVKEVIGRYVMKKLPKVFFALYFREEWITNENENYA